jgi:hypothetical protein
MNYYEETLKFVDETDIYNCLRKFENNYWINDIKSSKTEKINRHLDTMNSWDFDDLGVIEDTLSTLTIHLNDLTINYEEVLHDLKLSNKRWIPHSSKCLDDSKGNYSIPVFNIQRNRAVVESKGRTYIFEKDEAGKWKFERPGIIIIH